MARLTRKLTQKDIDEQRKYYKEQGLNVVPHAKVGDYTLTKSAWDNSPTEKLGKLEDIEEELGVDLIKLLTAKTIFTIANDYGGIFYHIDIENGGVYTSKYDADDEFYPFSDYGKTWAFTREELEK